MPISNIAIIWTTIFEWCVVRCGSKNGHQKDMFSNKIGFGAQKYANHCGLISNRNWENLHDHLMSTGILTLIMKNIYI